MPVQAASERRHAINVRADKWDRANTMQFKVKLNIRTDADIIAQLEKQENRQGYVKRLIREDIAKGGQ